jgi:AmiR/NasT family two-component response regulator
MAQETIARSRATRAQVLQGRSQRDVLHHSAFARLAARQETMAVIEQAKGIIMGQQRCGPREAFDLLRQASQRTNIKVHVLAAQIVEHISSSDNDDNVTPITLGATRYPRPGTRARLPAG